jgi:hypothetical protein
MTMLLLLFASKASECLHIESSYSSNVLGRNKFKVQLPKLYCSRIPKNVCLMSCFQSLDEFNRQINQWDPTHVAVNL